MRLLRVLLAALVGVALVAQYLVFAALAAALLPLKYVALSRRWYIGYVTWLFNLTSVFVVAATWLCGRVTVHVYGEMLPAHGEAPKRRGMLLFNHLSYCDAPLLGCWAAVQPGVSSGSFRWVSIRYLLRMPHGWLHWMRDDVFVGGRPKGELAERLDAAALQAGLDGVADDDPASPQWLFFAPEGSIQTPALRTKAVEWANANGIVPLKHLLLPRTRAFTLACRRLAHCATDVFDVTIGYPGGKRYMPLDCLVARPGGLPIHMHLRRLAPPPATASDAELAAWLLLRFREKDALLDEFYRTGAFPHARGIRYPTATVYGWAAQALVVLGVLVYLCATRHVL